MKVPSKPFLKVIAGWMILLKKILRVMKKIQIKMRIFKRELCPPMTHF